MLFGSCRGSDGGGGGGAACVCWGFLCAGGGVSQSTYSRERGVREEGGFSSIRSEHRSSRIFSFSLESLWNGAVREHKVLLQALMRLSV